MLASLGQGSGVDSRSAASTGAPTGRREPSAELNIPQPSPAPSMGCADASILPPTPRALPFKFNELNNANGKTFGRAYYYSEDLSEVRAKARALAADSNGVSEIRNHSAVAEKFLIGTMQKLGVSLP